MTDLDELFDFELDLDIFDFEVENVRVPKRYVRDFRNPLEWLSNTEFFKRYRFHKETVVQFILPRVETRLEPSSQRGLPIPPLLQLLMCLRFFATGCVLTANADVGIVSQGTVSLIVKRVSELIARERSNFIKFPKNQKQIEENKVLFLDNGIPDVIGVIDCTHVRLINAPNQQISEEFRNRKSFFSSKVQAVSGPRGEFLDIVARWGGSVLDRDILERSRLHARLLEKEFDGVLLGDTEYPCLPFLLTPVLNPQSVSEERYNSAHTKTQNVVKQMFQVWKKRFPCLARGLGNKLETVGCVIVACAVLHNIAILANDVIYVEADSTGALDNIVPDDPVVAQNGEGISVRRAIIDAHFA